MIRSKFYTLKDLTASKRAEANGLMHIQNNPNESVILNLQLLVDNVLDPLTIAYSKFKGYKTVKKLPISSCYRCIELNNLLKGSKTSAHVLGLAVDIDFNNLDINKEFYIFASGFLVNFDQLINEYNYDWVHIGYRKTKNRKMKLKII